MRELKFSKETGTIFSKDLREAVDGYFAANKCDKYGDIRMYVKSAFMLLLFIVPIITISTGVIVNIVPLFALYLLSGLGMAGIGMSVMHDALHNSYSKEGSINKLMGYSINLIGASSTIWKIQHNVLHHNYTNIDDADDDLNTPGVLRFSPGREKHALHKYQFIYAWFFYGLMTLMWVTVRDFIRANQFNKMGFFKKDGEFRKELWNAFFWKVFYFSYALVLPLIMVPQAWWIVVLAFFSMHFLTGLILSSVFQTAHVMPSSEFPKPDSEGVIGNSWSIHQLATTSNYAPKSRIFSWFVGGLNYQIEHHLLPHVCHVHYRGLSEVVKKTAEKHGIPYNTRRTFAHAVYDHILMLKLLGK